VEQVSFSLELRKHLLDFKLERQAPESYTNRQR